MDNEDDHEPKKGRGPVKKIKSSEPRAIKFNSHGQPIGDKFVRFSNQVGLITRKLVPITHENWHKVPKKTKARVWSQVKALYHIENDDAKKEMLKQCGSVWKRWKTSLRKKFMDKGQSPCKKYTSIKKKHWEEFVAKENSLEKMEKRELGRQNTLKKKLPPRLGPKGYRGWEEAWNEEAKLNELPNDVHKIYDPRSRRWVLARLQKDGENVKYVPIELSPYLDELLQLDSQMQEGSWKPESGSDLLSTVVGPEHSGHLRTVGPIGLRKGLENYKETKKRTTLKEMQKVQDELRATIVNMQENYDKQLEVIRNRVGVGRPEMEAETVVCPGIRKSSCGSTKMADPFEGIQVPTKCSLLVPNIDRDVICAKGMVYSTGSGVVHGVPIREGHVKVHVDYVEKKYTTLDIPISVPSAEIYELIQAHNTFIQWPKRAILIEAGTNIPTQSGSRNERASSSRKSLGSTTN